MERCSFQNSGPCLGELMSLVSLSDGEKDVRGHLRYLKVWRWKGIRLILNISVFYVEESCRRLFLIFLLLLPVLWPPSITDDSVTLCHFGGGKWLHVWWMWTCFCITALKDFNIHQDIGNHKVKLTDHVKIFWTSKCVSIKRNVTKSSFTGSLENAQSRFV